MATVVDICNMALANLADEANVSSIDPPEGSAQADHCATFYPIARDTILESHAWSFATRRIMLASLTPEWDAYTYAYMKPSNMLRILSIYDPDITDEQALLAGQAENDFIIEIDSNGDEVIMTNVESAACRYIVRVEDTTKYSMMFINTVAAYLSSLLSGPIIQGPGGVKMADYWNGKAMAYLERARALDANSQRRRLHYTPAPIRARD